MKGKLIATTVVGILSLAAFAYEAQAYEAAPPVGVWQGDFHDGSGSMRVSVYGNGTMGFEVTGGTPVVGSWSWNPTATGGIITLHYYNAGFASRAYYSVTYLNDSTILFSDPYFRVTLYRRF